MLTSLERTSPMPAPSDDARDLVGTFLRERFPALAGAPLSDGTALVGGGAIDSLGILDLVAFLEERLGIVLTDDDFDPANFETFGHLMRFIGRARP
ncbi:acyl carrier protein [Phreatobacter sp.]|uniref:acyl carrier protein n=1 Tax=Phreatobacter sp. TaxID=1966341 RepID=UPI003F706520